MCLLGRTSFQAQIFRNKLLVLAFVWFPEGLTEFNFLKMQESKGTRVVLVHHPVLFTFQLKLINLQSYWKLKMFRFVATFLTRLRCYVVDTRLRLVDIGS